MWRIVYPGVSHDFGAVNIAAIQIAGNSYRVDDSPQPRTDGVFMGQDFADPGDIVLFLSIPAPGGDTESQMRFVREQAESFSAVWDAATVRGVSGAVAELHADSFGVFEGRPRMVEWDTENYAVGFLHGKARFVRTTLDVFESEADGGGWHEVTLGLVPAQVGGLKSPLRSPLRTSVESSRAAPITVGGTSPAWPIVTMRGPIQSGAVVECVGRWRLILNRALAYDRMAVIDTRPGQTSTLLDSSPVQLLDPRSSLLADAFLRPGENIIALRGASIEGTASVSLRWRNTKAGI